MKNNHRFLSILFYGLSTFTSVTAQASLMDITAESCHRATSHTAQPFNLATFNVENDIKVLHSFVQKELLRETDHTTILFLLQLSTVAGFDKSLDMMHPLFCGPEKTRHKNIARLSPKTFTKLENTLTQTLTCVYQFISLLLADERERLQNAHVDLSSKIAARMAQRTYSTVTDAFIRLSSAYVTILKDIILLVPLRPLTGFFRKNLRHQNLFSTYERMTTIF